MKKQLAFLFIVLVSQMAFAQFNKDSSAAVKQEMQLLDTMPTINLPEVDIISFRTKEEWDLYYKYRSRIRKVMPYVKIAKSLYKEMEAEKEAKKRGEFRQYRKDLEKEMRQKFEKELKDLSIGQGQMMVKLINRETGNNCYGIIKNIKGGFSAWWYQQIGKKWGYNLKEQYDPEQEKMIELIIRQMGPMYDVG